MTSNSPTTYEKLMECTHCGLCLPFCPTYRELKVEMDSPRGRIYLIRALEDGRVGTTTTLAKHLDLCVGCLACETACPSDVAFGHVLERGRSVLGEASESSSILLDLLYRSILPKKNRIVALGRLLRVYQSSRWGFQGLPLVRNSSASKTLGRLLEVLGAFPSKPKPVFDQVYESRASNGKRVGLLVCCMMRVLLTNVNDATIRVLNRSGFDVEVPPSQECCGALHAHVGRLDEARRLAKLNIEAFGRSGEHAILTNSAGCGAHMKHYSRLFEGDPEWEGRAKRFSQRVRDVSEFLASDASLEELGSLPYRVAYDDPCHLLHGQRVGEQPRKLLQQIPGLELVDLREPDWCCGSAGTYMITQREMALKLLERKLEDIRASGADVVASGNPGCLLWIGWGLQRENSPVRCLHPVELLDMAHGPTAMSL